MSKVKLSQRVYSYVFRDIELSLGSRTLRVSGMLAVCFHDNRDNRSKVYEVSLGSVREGENVLCGMRQEVESYINKDVAFMSEIENSLVSDF